MNTTLAPFLGLLLLALTATLLSKAGVVDRSWGRVGSRMVILLLTAIGIILAAGN
jgi:hypothetical protein